MTRRVSRECDPAVDEAQSRMFQCTAIVVEAQRCPSGPGEMQFVSLMWCSWPVLLEFMGRSDGCLILAAATIDRGGSMSVFAADDGYEVPAPTEAELTAFLMDSGMDLGTAVDWLRSEDRALPDYDDLFEDDE
jgi:hypothetical protein